MIEYFSSKNRLGKLLILVVTALMITLAACSNDGGNNTVANQPNTDVATNDKASDKPLYTIKVLVTDSNNKLEGIRYSDELKIGQIIKDKFNINFELIKTDTGAHQEKLNLMLAAGDYPEILWITDNDLVNKYQDAGALMPLDDYLDQSPEFVNRFQKYFDAWRAGEDNKIYKWEGRTPSGYLNYAPGNDIAVRTDLLEQQGWPKLLSTDDYVNFLKKALELNPQTNGNPSIGMVSAWAGDRLPGIIPQIMFEKGGRYWVWIQRGTVFNHDTNTFEDFGTNEYVLEGYQFMNELYREGILSKEAFTDGDNQVQEKMNSGQALSVFYMVYFADAANQILRENGNAHMQYITLPLRSNKQIERNEKRILPEFHSNPFLSVAITKNAQDPARIMELINWISSYEGQTLLQSGIEGEHYTIVDGIKEPTQKFKDIFKGNVKDDFGFDVFEKVFPIFEKEAEEDGQMFSMISEPRVRDEFKLSERQIEAYNKLGYDYSAQYWVETGRPETAEFTNQVVIDTTSEFGVIEEQLLDLRRKTAPKLVYANSEEEFEKAWNDYLNDHNKLNPQKLVDKYNELYQDVLNRMN